MGVHYNKADFITYGKPSLFLDFANKKSLIDRISGNNLITFTRSSTATYVGADGLIKTASANEARFDHDPDTGESLGLLIEEGRTNYVANSTAVQGVNLISASLTVSSVSNITSPDGTTNGVVRYTTSGGSGAYRFPTSWNAGAPNTPYTGSIWARAVNTSASFNIDVIDMNITGFTVGEQWTRVSVTAERSDVSYRFFDVNASDNQDLYLWGPQIEQGNFPTSYIPTSGSTVTRTVDSALLSTSNWWDYTQGTAYAEYRGGLESNQSGYGRVWSPSGAATFIAGDQSHISNNRHSVWFGGSTVNVSGQEHLSAFAKNAMTYSNNGTNCNIVNVSYPAILTGTTNSSVTSTFHGIGRNASATTNMLNGHIKQLIYYPTILTNAQLQSRTK